MNIQKRKLIPTCIAILLLIIFTLKPIQLFILKIASIMLGSELLFEDWGNDITNFSISVLIGLIFFIPTILGLHNNELSDIQNNGCVIKNKFHNYGFLFIVALTGISLCSTTSFLYSFHYYDDAHCFFTVGKSLLHNKVLYRDIYEQKGPILYFIHTIAALISEKSFLGVYFIQVISAFVFLIYSYKILKLFLSELSSLYILPLIFAVIISSTNYICGDSCEELSFALIIIPFYFSVKNIKLNQDFSKMEMFISGLFAGLIFWMKFTLVGFFFGWAIVPVYRYIKNKQIKSLLICIIFLILGVIASTLPSLIYFTANHSLPDLFQVYIHDNIFEYAAKPTHSNVLIYKITFLILSFGKMCIQNPFDTLLLIFSFISIFILKKMNNKECQIHILLCYIAAFFFIYIGGVRHTYYSLLLSVFLIFSTPVIENFFIIFKLNNKLLSIFSISGFIFIILLLSPHWKAIGNKYETKAEFRISKIINDSKTEEYTPTLLNYGKLDFGIYFLTDIIPSEKYFCWLNVDNKEMQKQQNKCIEDKRVDYVVTVTKENYEKVMAYNTYELLFEQDGMYLFGKKSY